MPPNSSTVASAGVSPSDRKRLTRVIDALLAKHRFVEIHALVAHGEVKWIRTNKSQTLEEAETELGLAPSL